MRYSMLLVAACLGCLFFNATSQAALTLTADGVSRGFALTTFATGFPTVTGIGPRGIEYLPNGQVLVSSLNGQIRKFDNVDGQSALTVSPFVTISGADNANGMAYIGSSTNIFLAQHANDRVVELDASGNLLRTVATIPSALALRAQPSTGHLFVTGSGTGTIGGVFEVDPVTGNVTTISTDKADGITMTPDGSTIYVANYGGTNGGKIVGYDTTTKAVVFDSGAVPGEIDGLALGFGPLLGNLYANTNDGILLEVHLSNLVQTLIATGGSRGDLVGSDPANTGDVLISQSDSVVRLTGVPEPTSLGLLGLAGLALLRRRRQ